VNERRCAWCRGPIESDPSKGAVTCSKACRQRRWRFLRQVGGVAPDVGRDAMLSRPLRLAYADPPYPGLSRRYYEGHPDYAGEVDHRELVSRLEAEYPDGWALSTSSDALQYVLSLCPPDVRVASWHREPRRLRAAGPVKAWEPVIFRGGRLDVDLSPVDERHQPEPDEPSVAEEYLDACLADLQNVDIATMRALIQVSLRTAATAPVASTRLPRRIDTLEWASRPRLGDPDRVVGAKPARFARWMFDLLGALPHDTLDDLYPGSRGISRAWAHYASSALAEATPEGAA
jgi:hypothetical protein